jgi:hypothetical protein
MLSLSKSTALPSDVAAVLDPFQAVLRSPSPITLPQSALYGAITHFLSTLTDSHLVTFTSYVVGSPSLWNASAKHSLQVRNACRLSVSAKITNLDNELDKAYWSERRIGRQGRKWMDGVMKGAIRKGEGLGRLDMLIGMLQGMDDCAEMDWGSARIQAEEEVIMTLAEPVDEERGYLSDYASLEKISAVLPHVAEERLRALDLKVGCPLHWAPRCTDDR